MEDVEESSAAAWRKQLDLRLLTGTGSPADPVGCLEVAALACRCLAKRKKRPPMTEVRDFHSSDLQKD